MFNLYVRRTKYLFLGSLFFICILSICSCAKDETSNNKNILDARYGIVQTSLQQNKTCLDIYDSNCKLLKSQNYNVCGVGRFGYGSPQSLNGVLYEIAVGNDYKKDLGLVIGFDLRTGKIKKYHFNRTNLVDLQIIDKYIYTISNINGKTYIDRYCFESQEIDSFCWNKELMTDFAVTETGNVFFVNPKGTIYFLEFDDKKTIQIGQLEQDVEPSHLHAVNDKLYISLFSNEIMVVDARSRNITMLDLGLECGGQISDDGEYRDMASSNPVESLEDGRIVKVNMDTNEIVNKWNFDCDIYYFIIGKEDVTILSNNNNELRRYLLQKGKLGKMRSAKLDEKYTLSSVGSIENSR